MRQREEDQEKGGWPSPGSAAIRGAGRSMGYMLFCHETKKTYTGNKQNFEEERGRGEGGREEDEEEEEKEEEKMEGEEEEKDKLQCCS